MKKSVSFSEIEPLILESLDAGKTIELTVKGNSMNPFFVDGKTVVTLKRLSRSLQKNDIVLAKAFGKAVLHRIVKIDGETIVLQGDGNTTTEMIHAGEIIAHVISYRNKKTIDLENQQLRFAMYFWIKLRFLRRYFIRLWRWTHRDELAS